MQQFTLLFVYIYKNNDNELNTFIFVRFKNFKNK